MLNISPPNYIFCPFCGQNLDQRTEENKGYKFCKHCNWTYYPHVFGSAVAIVIRSGKILMVKRAREPYKNTWSLPGGYIQFGEHPEETAIRELFEETGLKGQIKKLLKVYQLADDTRAPGHLGFSYFVEALGEIADRDRDENSEVVWQDLHNLPEVGWESVKDTLRIIVDNPSLWS